MKVIYPKNEAELKEHILKKIPSLYVMSKTSTVIPYDFLEEIKEEYLVDLSQLEKEIRLERDHLIVRGAVTWEDAIQYLANTDRSIMTYPTEKSACILAGLATSATGEMAFGYGTFRSQIKSCKYLNHEAREISLSNQIIKKNKDYSDFIENYLGFKNPPLPRFEKEVDLMIGTEGQLGIITEAVFKTVKKENYLTFFIKLPKWEEEINAHLEIVEKAQAFREDIRICEFLDSNSIKYLKNPIVENSDLIILEIKETSFEKIYEEFISKLDSIKEDDVFEIDSTKFQEMRVEIPRAVNEINSRNKVIKKGTDAQVPFNKFDGLLKYFRNWSELGIDYNLFGHIGDFHLHFNFLPLSIESDLVNSELESFYQFILKNNGSPFAEHGIGLIKQKFLKDFLPSFTTNYLKNLKKIHDPDNIFFPSGFMNIHEE